MGYICNHSTLRLFAVATCKSLPLQSTESPRDTCTCIYSCSFMLCCTVCTHTMSMQVGEFVDVAHLVLSGVGTDLSLDPSKANREWLRLSHSDVSIAHLELNGICEVSIIRQGMRYLIVSLYIWSTQFYTHSSILFSKGNGAIEWYMNANR